MQQATISLSLADIAARLGGDVLGAGQTQITQVAPLNSAAAGQISFLVHRRYRHELQTTQASAVIVPVEFAEATTLPRIVTANPHAYYARVAGLLNPPPARCAGVHPQAVSESALPECAQIGPQVVIGRNVQLGQRVVIGAGSVLGDGVQIGDDTVLHPRVTVYAHCAIGARGIIHSGTVIGADGFGFALDAGRWVKIPQIAGVRIGDDVEIGANTTIDRGALNDTLVGNGVKLDNQIQIGHGCVIGDHTVIAGCVGIAGSTRIGSGCMLGGAAMILGHLEIADGVIVSPGSMVMKDIRRAGKYTAIYPLEPHERWLQNGAQLRRLSQLAERLEKIEVLLEQNSTGH